MQHGSPDQIGTPRDPLPEGTEIPKNRVLELPTEYAVIPPCFLNAKLGKCTPTEKCTFEVREENQPLEGEKLWLNGFSGEDSYVPWAEYHSRRDSTERNETNIAVLQLCSLNQHIP